LKKPKPKRIQHREHREYESILRW